MELKLSLCGLSFNFCTLLIVPYGIETVLFGVCFVETETFNCTLWNWNNLNDNCKMDKNILLIVPYGIETCQKLWLNMQPTNF